MSDRHRYFEEPERLRLETTVVARGEDGDRRWLRLAETLFHPEGGGQPADRGTIGGVEVTDVRETEDGIRHYVTDLPDGDAVEILVDGTRRRELSQQHTAQHLITSLLLQRHGLPTTGFHLGEEYTAIEVDGPVPDEASLRAFEEEANEAVRTGAPVRTRWVPREELDALGVRSRGLPTDHTGPVRLVEIEGFDLNTCGGTHVPHLGALGTIHLIGAEPARGGARIRFLAGDRVLRHLRTRARWEEELKERTSAAPEDFATVLDSWVEERKRLARRVEELTAELAGRLAAELAAEKEPAVPRVLPPGGPSFLAAVADRFLTLRPGAVAALAAKDPDTGAACFLVRSGPDGPADVSELGAEVRDRLGARGGGRGRLFQGVGGRL